MGSQEADDTVESFGESLETLFWLSQPGVLADITAAEQDRQAGRLLDEPGVRAKFNVPRR